MAPLCIHLSDGEAKANELNDHFSSICPIRCFSITGMKLSKYVYSWGANFRMFRLRSTHLYYAVWTCDVLLFSDWCGTEYLIDHLTSSQYMHIYACPARLLGSHPQQTLLHTYMRAVCGAAIPTYLLNDLQILQSNQKHFLSITQQILHKCGILNVQHLVCIVHCSSTDSLF